MAAEFYVHTKTGNLYCVLRWDIVNTTNAQDGQRMVHYTRWDDPDGLHFVRREIEFDEKFEPEQEYKDRVCSCDCNNLVPHTDGCPATLTRKRREKASDGQDQ
jgi:hypothetical protein